MAQRLAHVGQRTRQRTDLVAARRQARAYCGQGSSTAPTIPAVAQLQLNHTWTYTGSSLVTIPKVVLYNSLAVAGTIPMLETLLNAQATVNTTGDTIQLAGWLINL